MAKTYMSQVNASHKKFKTALSRAKTKKSVSDAYSRHKKEHQKLLAKHLKEELALVTKIKSKMD